MPLYTYYDTHTVEKFKKVSDPELNELFQEVRNIDDGYYIKTIEGEENRGWFVKPRKYKIYTILYHSRNNEYQVLNLSQDGLDIDINTSIVGAYLIGFLNGNRKTFKQ
jgi:hypothetical protein